MFNIGFPELLVIFGVALLALGPERLPDLARRLGKLTADLRRQTDSLRREFYNEVYKPVDQGTRDFRNVGHRLDESVRDFGKNLLEETPKTESTSPTPPDTTCTSGEKSSPENAKTDNPSQCCDK